MEVIHSIAEMMQLSRNWADPAQVGFVPTMGYLHAGHLSLVKKAKVECAVTAVSIFVNPSQFGPQEDLDTYPRDLEHDLKLLQTQEVDYVFCPTAQDMYPQPFQSWVHVEGLSEVLCGASRPGHFRGVATVMMKLINLVHPGKIFMGEKDFQQVVVLQAMLKDLNLDCRIVPCPIIREEDGLALSSRNVHLKGDDRQRALCLVNAIHAARQLYADGQRDVFSLFAAAQHVIREQNCRIDYIKFVDPATLKEVTEASDNTRMVLAVYVGITRLIDNAPLKA